MMKTIFIEKTEEELINLALLLAEQYLKESIQVQRTLGNHEEQERQEALAKEFRLLADKRIHDYKAT